MGKTDASIILAKNLLGNVLEHNGKQYMITVTEAYPYNDTNGYIQRQKKTKSGKAYKILSDERNIGKPFLYGGMIHYACEGAYENGLYLCGNVLIRGAVQINKNDIFLEDAELNFISGKPTVLAERLDVDNESVSELRILPKPDWLEIDEPRKDCRIGLNDNNNYRFYILHINSFKIKDENK